MAQEKPLDSVVQFLRRKDYTLAQILGQGACGQTVLLRDDQIGRLFVCKKYAPYFEGHREAFFANFLREIQLLHEVYHQNIVRIFNYYLYPEKLTGYILMEYVEGQDIETHLSTNPDGINEIFRQTIDGFANLEASSILHRDIRAQNILIRTDGLVKIIDLGFGKQVQHSNDFDKSISLNWWCELPMEFADRTYDFSTEVYFVGKLFEKIISEFNVRHFKFSALLARMCKTNPSERISKFSNVQSELTNVRVQSENIAFDYFETQAYREFADDISTHVTKIESDAKYLFDIERLPAKLEEVLRACMLEESLLDCAPLLRCLLSGTYYYRKAGFRTSRLRAFIEFLRTASPEKQKIVLANLHTRLDAIPRYTQRADRDDIPF